MNDEILEWQTRSVEFKVARILIMDHVSFRYNEEQGIVFSAPKSYVKNMVEVLMNCYGVNSKPVINEVKQ
jgi:hypothetical protein|nr:MAG TPA: hypothetical protein [Caudoviricetes sp.]